MLHCGIQRSREFGEYFTHELASNGTATRSLSGSAVLAWATAGDPLSRANALQLEAATTAHADPGRAGMIGVTGAAPVTEEFAENQHGPSLIGAELRY